VGALEPVDSGLRWKLDSDAGFRYRKCSWHRLWTVHDCLPVHASRQSARQSYPFIDHRLCGREAPRSCGHTLCPAVAGLQQPRRRLLSSPNNQLLSGLTSWWYRACCPSRLTDGSQFPRGEDSLAAVGGSQNGKSAARCREGSSGRGSKARAGSESIWRVVIRQSPFRR
jgi:hypothetical protein